jgi:hypothetical protein
MQKIINIMKGSYLFGRCLQIDEGGSYSWRIERPYRSPPKPSLAVLLAQILNLINLDLPLPLIHTQHGPERIDLLSLFLHLLCRLSSVIPCNIQHFLFSVHLCLSSFVFSACSEVGGFGFLESNEGFGVRSVGFSFAL